MLVDETARVTGRLGNASTILKMCLLLHLTDRGRGAVLLTVVEGVVLLGDFQTEDRVANESTDKDYGTECTGDLRSLQLEMHSRGRIGQLVVQIFVDVTRGMGKIVSEVIGVHVVVVDEAATVESLRSQVEANIVPVGGPDFIVGMLRVTEILGQGHGQRSGFEQGHLTLEVLVFASVVLS